jgi:exopolyphosphatase/pppGpp-phosphohydrolase
VPADSRQAIGAAVDLGSNSVHLLVARVVGHRLEVVDDQSVFLGLGAAIAERGLLGRPAREELSATLEGYAGIARGHGATTVTFLGTEPIRRAADAAQIAHDIEVVAATPLHVLSHEEEAFLTVIGVTEGMPVTHETLVVDVGGGSTECCVVDARHRPRAVGLRLGSAMLGRRQAAGDPPTSADLDAMRGTAADELRGAPDAAPVEIVAVGGTATNLLKVLPAAAADQLLTRERIAEVEAILGTEPSAAAAERHGINPVRARLLPAGGVILDALLERYGAETIRVSEAGVREGAVLAVTHAGVAWRDQLAELAHGWRG